MKTSSEIKVAAAQLKLLERLCQANAVSGDEGEARKIVLEAVRPLADEVTVDALGNVLARRNGRAAEGQPLNVMLAAHMDEVGMMVTKDEGEGILRFEIVGGIDVRQLPGKAVSVGKDHVPGVIGAKPIHLTSAEERRHTLTLEGLRIDVGLGGSGKIKVGDRASFATPFTRIGPSLRAKALDNRFGVAALITLLQNPPENINLQLAFTVQEENGLRGAHVAAYAFNPDIAIAVDATPAYDLPAWDDSENERYNTRLGAGPAIYIADRATLSDPRLVRHFIETAEALGIPYQIRQPGGGGTDAGAMHKQRAGIPSLSISTPHRYSHTPASLARLSDWENTLRLLHGGLGRITAALLQTARG